MRNVLLINSDRTGVLARLAGREDIAARVVTAEPYVHLYRDRYPTTAVRAMDAVDEIRDAAMSFALESPLTHVLAATEKSVVPAAMVRAHLGLQGITPDQAVDFTHKHAMKARLRAHGVPVARSALCAGVGRVPEVADALGWPVVVKPVTGSGGKSTFRVGTRTEYDRMLASGRLDQLAARRVPIQVEEFVPMVAEYHCDSVVRNGRPVFASVSRYFVPLLTVNLTSIGGSYLIGSGSPEAERALALNDRVIRAYGEFDGITHLECFETADGLLVGEVTCRPAGGAIPQTLRRALGVDLWNEFISAEVGADPKVRVEPHPGTFGWSYLRAGPAALRRIRDLPGVTQVEPHDGAADVFVAHLYAGDEDEMAELHGRISREREPVGAGGRPR